VYGYLRSRSIRLGRRICNGIRSSLHAGYFLRQISIVSARGFRRNRVINCNCEVVRLATSGKFANGVSSSRVSYCMKRLASLFVLFACLTLGQPEQAKFVSTAFGDKVKLYEQENSGLLTFTLVNGMPSAIEQYLIETWSTEEHGAPILRSCITDTDHAKIAPYSTVTVQETCTLVSSLSAGRLSHSSRIIAMRLANGWKWHVPVQYRLTK
jgi:hypothetical protein